MVELFMEMFTKLFICDANQVIPNSGQQFVRWDYVSGGIGAASTPNPYTFTVSLKM